MMRRWVSHLSRQALQGAQVDYYFYPSSCVSRDLSVSLVDLYMGVFCTCFICFHGKERTVKGNEVSVEGKCFFGEVCI